MLKRIILLMILSGCTRTVISNTCPSIIEYTKEENNKIIFELIDYNEVVFSRQQKENPKLTRETFNKPFLNKIISDYLNLREQVRICEK